MKHTVVNLGCKVNRVESDTFERRLRDAGSLPTEESEADLIIVNTCTVTGDAEKKARKAVRHALRANPEASIVVTGCAAAITPAVFSAMDARVTVVPKEGMDSFLDERLFADGDAVGESHLATSRQRIGVKVQDGCDNACTYCIVHVARGPARSRDEEAILADTLRLVRGGVREIVLTGINLGAYGREREDRSLARLLDRLLSASAPYADDEGRPCRFRLSSIEPTDVDDMLLETIARSDGRVCRHLHLPLQAGSSKVLDEMGRPYTAEDYARLTARVRRYLPRVALSTDVIVGFPGESDDDFARTISLSEACAFASMHVFPYSRREGTLAAARTDQIPSAMKTERAARLRDLARTMRDADRRARCGTTELVLVERPGRGMTESYHEIDVPPDAPIGVLRPYRFT